MKGPAIGVVTAVLALAGAIAWWAMRGGEPAAQAPPPEPTTQVAHEQPVPATQPQTVATFLDVVREIEPKYPTTQPLEYVVKFAESAKLIVDRPIYIDSRRDLWITHPDAPPLETTLKTAADEQVHVVPVKVSYVHWRPGERGKWEPMVVVDRGNWKFDVIHPDGQRHPVSSDGHHWSRAVEWNGLTFVPMSQSVGVFNFRGERVKSEDFHFTESGLIDVPSGFGDETDRISHAFPMIIPNLRGVLAFIPADSRGPGATKTARFVDGKWTLLDLKDSEKQLQLIPLLDGSLLRILQGEGDDRIRLDLTTLEPVEVDREKILALVEQLSDLEQAERDKALAELQRYGQGIWPILEPIAEDQPAEARVRLRQVLRNKISPTLAGMQIVADRLRVVERQPNNTVIFHAPQGVRLSNERDQSSVVANAWIAAGPWTGIRLLPHGMTHELQPGKDVVRFVGGDWIVTNSTLGPRQWVGNSFVDLLDKQHRRFMFVLGSDRASRWYFTEHDPAGKRGLDQPVLILDRRLPDATPRLPVWNWNEPRAQLGWDEKGFPGMRAGGAFVLDRTEWRNLDLNKEQFYTKISEMPPTTMSATQPTTTQSYGSPILTAPDGRQYFDGQKQLVIIDADGTETRWPLPPEAMGDAAPHLLRTEDGRLFLFNQPGRIVRIRPTPDGVEPFEVEAVFTKGIPNERSPRRIWLDPAGRLVILIDDHRMAIAFPEGRIPRPISLLMPAGAADEEW